MLDVRNYEYHSLIELFCHVQKQLPLFSQLILEDLIQHSGDISLYPTA